MILINIPRIYFLLFLLLLGGCSTTHYSIDSYRHVSREISKNYGLSHVDLILAYDLAKLDDSGCIFSKEFGLFANESSGASAYLKKFKSHYKSPRYLSLEARVKIKKISNLLIKLQDKYKILSKGDFDKVAKLSKANLSKLDAKAELIKLDKIATYIPIMLPAYDPCFSSGYGNRKHPISNKYKMHCGIDLVAKERAPIYSAAYGKVHFVGKKAGYGTVVEIEHGSLFKTRYAHLKEALVKKGQKVIRGQAIGLQGCSGNATGDHLHFEVHMSKTHVNPYDFVGYNYECR